MDSGKQEENVSPKVSQCVCGKASELRCVGCETVFCSPECSRDEWRTHADCIKQPKLSRISITVSIPKESITSSFPKNEDNEVMVGAILNDTELFVSMVQEGETFITILAGIENKDQLPKLSSIYVRNLALVKITGIWYRIRIVEVGEDAVLVEFIDHGGRLVVKKGDLRAIPEELKTLKPLAVKVVLVKTTVTKEKIRQGDFICVRIVENEEDSECVAKLLERLGLDKTMAEKFDELSQLGVLKFNPAKENDAKEMSTSSVKLMNSVTIKTNEGDEEIIPIEKLWTRITHLRRAIEISKNILRKWEEDEVIQDADFLNMVEFSVHSASLEDIKIEFKQMRNMMIALTYSSKFVKWGIDKHALLKLNDILKWKVDADEERAKLYQSEDDINEFIRFFNESLSCKEDKVVHSAMGVVLHFLRIAPFKQNMAEQIAFLLCNVIFSKKGFPSIIFPIEQNNKFKETVEKAIKQSQHTDCLQFFYNCCVSSLEFYLTKLRKRIQGREDRETM